MSKLNRQVRRFDTKESMVRILRPDFKSGLKHKTPELWDYIEVPRLSLYGEYNVESFARFTKNPQRKRRGWE
jgi:hypothetical protein